MSQSLKAQIEHRLSEARKSRNRLRTTVLSSALSDVRNLEIEKQHEADDEMVREVLARGLKQRREAAEQMRAGDREELAAKEDREAGILSEFLPPPLGEDEVRGLVREIVADGASGVGPVMGRLMPKIRGRFDGKEASRIVREELAP